MLLLRGGSCADSVGFWWLIGLPYPRTSSHYDKKPPPNAGTSPPVCWEATRIYAGTYRTGCERPSDTASGDPSLAFPLLAPEWPVFRVRGDRPVDPLPGWGLVFLEEVPRIRDAGVMADHAFEDPKRGVGEMRELVSALLD